MIKAAVLLLVMMLCMSGITGCGGTYGNTWNGISNQSFYFDTMIEITIYGLEEGIPSDDSDEAFEEASKEIIADTFKLLSDYEKLLSRTVDGSDIDRINKAGGEPVEVSGDTLEVIRKGMEFGEISGGAFDITVGKASGLWDFHEGIGDEEEVSLPDPKDLEEASKHIDYTKIVIDEDASTVKLEDPEMMLDLGGIAKGFIADMASEYLRTRGVTGAIINLGGNIETVGGKPQGTAPDSEISDFNIGIRDPREEGNALLGIYPSKDVTVVTSGTYERYIEVDGKRYHHILDPSTGYPVDTDVLQVSIIAEAGRSVDCDGLSTTCLALGTERGTDLIRKLDEEGTFGHIEAIFVTVDGEIIMTDDETDFERY